MLHQLCKPIDEEAEPPELPEKQAAKSLFCWEVCCLLCLLQPAEKLLVWDSISTVQQCLAASLLGGMVLALTSCNMQRSVVKEYKSSTAMPALSLMGRMLLA